MSTNLVSKLKGCIRDKIVNGLRDTGCGGAVMRKDLGKAEQLTGTIQKCVLADGSVVEANVTEDDVDTAYYAVAIVFRDSFHNVYL